MDRSKYFLSVVLHLRDVYVLVFYKDKSRNLSKIVLVLPSASVERVGVSRMRDFF